MRRVTLALSSLLSLALLFTLSNAAYAAEDDRYNDDDGYEETARVARVSLIRGDVSVRRAGGEKWERATLNLPLVEGDRLATGADSRLEIQIDARNFLRVGEYATLDIVTLREEGVALSLPEGTATLRLARFDREREYFEIDAPGTTVAAERAGLYRLDVTGEGRVRVTVREDGRARIYNENSGFTLRSDRTAELVRLGGSDESDWNFSDAASLDTWDTWVDERERYLAERLRYDGRDRYYDQHVWGAEELDAYGDWVSHSDYGYVWRPRTTVINNYYNWAPYRYGHWRHLPHYGWTWIGDEPWGWAPYHYGRWVYVNNYWCWAPRGYVGYRNRSWWRPALVAFVFVASPRGEHVAWYPLPYHQRDPHSNFWRRALNTDRQRKPDIASLKGTGPPYARAVSSLPAREFGTTGRGRPADQEIARKALAGEPVRGKLPLRPIDAPGVPDPFAAREKTGARAPRVPGGDAGGRTDTAANPAAAPLRRFTERPTGAARRLPGVALDEELRRARVFNNRDPLFGKSVKPAPVDAANGGERNAGGEGRGGRGAGGFDRGGAGEGRPTGALARPTRPVGNAPDSKGGDAFDKGTRDRVKPVRPATPDAEDAGEKQPNWKSQPVERPGRPDYGGGDDGERERRRERARPEVREDKQERPYYNPEPQPAEKPAPRYERPERKERPAPPPREERQERYERPEPHYERPAPPPLREERPAPAPREEKPAPPPQREEKRSAPEKHDGRARPSRGKPLDND
ncbi:MAG TPA: DUF6600 domain-containing protein [Pyrinomonadaceae bacterium]|nr:DUF6600 domain-containing protein [Pyrinomonadaceae bacterium]